jgi:tetratricopeptide (TPR) repeat protein
MSDANSLPDGLPEDLFAVGAQAHTALEDGRLGDAATLYRWVLGRARMDGDSDTEAAALHQLGIIASHLGRRDEAHDLYHQSLKIKQAQGNRAGQSATLHELGRMALEEGDVEGAVEYLNESLAIARALDDPASLIYTLDLRGQLARLEGDAPAAVDYYTEAQTLAEQTGRSDLAAPAAASLGDLAVGRGDLAAAQQQYELSRTYYRAAHDAEGETGVLLSMAALAARQEAPERAGDFYEVALERARAASGAPWAGPAAARALHGLGSLANRRGDYDAAINYARQSLALARALDDRRLGGILLASIGMATMNTASGLTDRAEFTRRVVRAFRAWAAALALLEPLNAPEAAQYREWIRQAGPIYRQVAESGALKGALAEWWPDG